MSGPVKRRYSIVSAALTNARPSCAPAQGETQLLVSSVEPGAATEGGDSEGMDVRLDVECSRARGHRPLRRWRIESAWVKSIRKVCDRAELKSFRNVIRKDAKNGEEG